MKFIYFLAYLSHFIFIFAVEIYKVNQRSISEKTTPSLFFSGRNFKNINIFNDEEAAFIILDDRRKNAKSELSESSNKSQNISLYYWFGSKVSKFLRWKTAENVADMISSFTRNIVVSRCVSGLEPRELQMITGRKYIRVRKLYKVKGKNNVCITRVPAGYMSITADDSFVLNAENVYVYNPPKANVNEKMKASAVAMYIITHEKRYRKKLIIINLKSFDMGDLLSEFDTYTRFKDFIEYLGADLNELPRFLYEQANLVSSENDWLFEKTRYDYIHITEYYYVPDTGINFYVHEKGIQWSTISERFINQTYLILDFKSNNSFIYFRKRSSHAAIKHVMVVGENAHSETTETWKYTSVVQDEAYAFELDFIILFPDLLPRPTYVK